ncbi:hypothetical protein H4S03_005975 [Coemansia sp. S3946]|nr:hypothetical protein H4S03_005975 [Coemansia sp. S3946]
MESTTILELVDIIKRELPARPKSDISIFSHQYVHELKAGRMNMNQMIQMRELVDEYGDDWDCIGKALGVPPSRARRNWVEHSGDVASRRRDAALSGSPWAAADDETLLKIVHGTTISGAIRWEQVSMVLDRSISACKQRLSAINRKRSRKQALDERVNSVTSEAQRQIKLNGAVDWSQVCQATGLGMHECLELSQHDVGKASWHYDPDSFSHSMVDRMTSFIEEYYPAPVPVNSRAVSNFMWVAMGDCIRIHNVFQGKFTWMDAEYEQAEALRAQGLAFKEVARRLSPMLSGQNVLAALKRYAWSKKVRTPYTSHRMEEISELIDQYAGKCPVDEILSKISKRIGKSVYKNHYYVTVFRLAAHPHYQTKSHNIDFNDVANRIVTGQITTKLAAKELDLPQCILALRIKHLSFKLLS